MAVLDALLEFSDAQTLSIGSGASIKSTNVSDLVGAGGLKDTWGNSLTPDIGEKSNLEWNCQVETTVVGAGSLTVALVSKAADVSISSGGTTHASKNLGATPAAGTVYSAVVPAGTVNRYIGCLYSASGGTITAGALDSWLNLDHEKHD
ncbi:MAG: hypothetical protein GWN94_14010 [Phycisphaerae bacterium]|nr:hypothetical protein [Phycisphaerae bacterium]